MYIRTYMQVCSYTFKIQYMYIYKNEYVHALCLLNIHIHVYYICTHV